MKKSNLQPPKPNDRQGILTEIRNRKMARSAHAYVRGNTNKFYEWLDSKTGHELPDGPAIWICGDCHVGNLGPVANTQGHVDIQIRDLDQTVIGNPSHDLIRLGLSLATAARGSDLPGIITAQMMEELMVGYEHAFEDGETDREPPSTPASVKMIMRRAAKRTWKHLARERIEDIAPIIPLGKCFWPISKKERDAIESLFEIKAVSHLATSLSSRDENAAVKVLDAAYWVKGCSSLGKLRYAVLLDVGKSATSGTDLCLIDIKEAVIAAAPRQPAARMPNEYGERVVEGARRLAPYLGERMIATRLLDQSVFLRELLPQDMKIEIDQLTPSEAKDVARYFAMVVGKAHMRQMDTSTRKSWRKNLQQNRSKTLDVPSWLWSSVVDLVTSHEGGYLEHCRRYALSPIKAGTPG
ncbi:MAG: DUF2252 family protein [Nitrosospira sp.]